MCKMNKHVLLFLMSKWQAYPITQGRSYIPVFTTVFLSVCMPTWRELTKSEDCWQGLEMLPPQQCSACMYLKNHRQERPWKCTNRNTLLGTMLCIWYAFPQKDYNYSVWHNAYTNVFNFRSLIAGKRCIFAYWSRIGSKLVEMSHILLRPLMKISFLTIWEKLSIFCR